MSERVSPSVVAELMGNLGCGEAARDDQQVILEDRAEARKNERQLQDRIHALEVQQAELLRQVRMLTEALDGQRGTLPEQAWHSARCMAAGRASCTSDCVKARSALATVTGMVP